MSNGTPLTFGRGDFEGFGLWGSCGHLPYRVVKGVRLSVVARTEKIDFRKTVHSRRLGGPLNRFLLSKAL